MDPTEKKVNWHEMDDEEHSDGEEQVQTTQEGDKVTSDPSKPYVSKGPRRGGRGGSRGSYNKDGRGGRGGFGGGQGRGGYNRNEGRPHYGEQQGDKPAYDRPKREKENEPKEEMLAKVNRLSDQDVAHIYLYDVDYKASLEDIKNCYENIAIIKIEKTGSGGGAYLLELTKRNAIDMIEEGPKSINNRPFYMKMGYIKRKPEEQWHTVSNTKEESYGGFQKNYGGYGNKPYGGGYGNKPQGERKPYKKPEGQEGQTEELSEDNKFFKRNTSGEQPTGPVKFTKTASSKEEGDKPKDSEANKANPFGEAKPRDEQEYLKKKEDEKKDAPVEKAETTTNNAPPGISTNLPPGIKPKTQPTQNVEEKKAGEEEAGEKKPRFNKEHHGEKREHHGPRKDYQGGKPRYNQPQQKVQVKADQPNPTDEKRKQEEKARLKNPFAAMNDIDDD